MRMRMRRWTLRLDVARGGLALVVLIGLAAPAASLVTNPVFARGWGVALNNKNEKCSFVAPNEHTLFKSKMRPSLSQLRGGAAATSASLSPDFVLKTLAPLMGGLISSTMSFSPLSSVLAARKSKTLGELNISPYPAQCGNAAAWLSYGVLLSNYWIIVPNIIGLLSGLFYSYTGYALGNAAQKFAIFRSFASYMSFIGLALACALGGVLTIAPAEVMGRVGIVLLMIYYTSPLSTIAKVVKDKDSTSIDAALTAVGIVNGCFWGSYGLAIADVYVYGPNFVGAAIATITTLIWFLFRKK